MARDGEARRVAYVDLSEGVEIDRSWFAAAGMRASESHRVRFHGAPVLALLGGPDELLREPWFGRDAIRTAASWAGIADAARAAALEALAPRALAGDDLGALAVGRIDTHAQTIDLLAGEAGRRADAHPDAAMRALLGAPARRGRARRAGDRRRGARAAGSRPFARGGALDRARRDLRSSCSSTGSTRWSCAPDARRSTGDAARASTSRPATRPTPTRGTSRRSAYEHAKYERTIAALGDRRYGAGFELGCSIGVLTARLAERCDELLAVDIAQSRRRGRARAPAARTTSTSSAARCRSEWPAGPFDLVVCSEVLYYWDRPTLEAALPSIGDSLAPAGACSPSTTARRRASIR